MTISPAIYSGLCATLASTFGKLSWFEFGYEALWLNYTIRIIFFCAMILLNSMVWTFFVRALQNMKTTVEATAVSTATNYILSGILGSVVFEEETGPLWWLGISLVVIGIIVINH